MVRIALACILILSGCASIPQWSDNPQDCKRWEEGFKKDLVTGVTKQLSRKYICVEEPEAIIILEPVPSLVVPV